MLHQVLWVESVIFFILGHDVDFFFTYNVMQVYSNKKLKKNP